MKNKVYILSFLVIVIVIAEVVPVEGDEGWKETNLETHELMKDFEPGGPYAAYGPYDEVGEGICSVCHPYTWRIRRRLYNAGVINPYKNK